MYDDAFSLDRPKEPKFPIWQSETFVDVDIFNDRTAVHEAEEQWNRVTLVSSGNSTLGRYFCLARQASELSAHLGLPMIFRGDVVSIEELEKHISTLLLMN